MFYNEFYKLGLTSRAFNSKRGENEREDLDIAIDKYKKTKKWKNPHKLTLKNEKKQLQNFVDSLDLKEKVKKKESPKQEQPKKPKEWTKIELFNMKLNVKEDLINIDKYLKKNFPYLTKIYLGDKRYKEYTIWKNASGQYNNNIIKYILDNKREKVEEELIERLALYIRQGGACYQDLSDISTDINQYKIEIDPSKNNIVYTLEYSQERIKEFNKAYNECNARANFFKKTLPKNIYENSKIQDAIKKFLKKYNEFIGTKKMINVKKKLDKLNRQIEKLEAPKKEPKKEPKKKTQPKKAVDKKVEEVKNLPVLTMDKMKDLIGEDKLNSLKKILVNKTNIKYKALYILSMMRGFLPPKYSEELIDKYGVEGMFKVYETFLKKHSGKLVNVPRKKGQMEKITPKSLYDKISNALPYEISNGKKYMTQEEYMNR